MGVRKKFDRELYNETDALAKKSVFQLLEANDEIHAAENSKKTGVDILVTKPDTDELLFNIECEIKRVWKDKNFQYESVQFPERKAKYAQLDKPTIFVMFNADQSAYLTVTSDDLLSSPKVEVPNKYNWKGEFFYQVPLTKVKFNDIQGSIKEILK